LNINFEYIDYLKNGTERQKLAYNTLSENMIMTILQPFDPILVGTIPINIDIETSDLDIICYFENQHDFAKTATDKFGKEEGFVIRKLNSQNNKIVVALFRIGSFDIEIFGQDIPTRRQNAYRHMIIEYNLLNERDESFRQKIISLKQQGYKTEPAFALALGISGNAYFELLAFEDVIQKKQIQNSEIKNSNF
jgi:hypothetical protein